jgi:hypothetical protein
MYVKSCSTQPVSYTNLWYRTLAEEKSPTVTKPNATAMFRALGPQKTLLAQGLNIIGGGRCAFGIPYASVTTGLRGLASIGLPHTAEEGFALRGMGHYKVQQLSTPAMFRATLPEPNKTFISPTVSVHSATSAASAPQL